MSDPVTASPRVLSERQRLEVFALAYHKATDGTGEGEYGCPGVTCPGVQRLADFLQSSLEALRSPAEAGEAVGEVESAKCEHCGQLTPLPDDTCMHCEGPLVAAKETP